MPDATTQNDAVPEHDTRVAWARWFVRDFEEEHVYGFPELQQLVDAIGSLEAEVERLREELTRIERLRVKWDAPVRSDDVTMSNRAWAAVGSEAVLIARGALNA